MGRRFFPHKKGTIAQRLSGGQKISRTCYAVEGTGHMLLHTLYDQLMKTKTTIYPEHYCLSLLLDTEGCHGAVLWDIVHGKIITARAKATLLATGGCGKIFATTSNARTSTGDGLALAYHAGIPLEDMEMIQFHPTGMYGKGFIVSEASRGEGAFLLNANGERFMKKYAPQKMELAPFDVAARGIAMEILQGKGAGSKKDHVFIDMRPLGKEKITERVPEIHQTVREQLGIDCTKDLIPITPTAHYSMGGIPTDTQTRVTMNEHASPVKGLYAAGEVACLSVHGANRLGGNSLLETQVFGRIAGIEMSEYARQKKTQTKIDETRFIEQAMKRIEMLLQNSKGSKSNAIQEKLQETMMKDCGIFRNKEGLQRGIRIRSQLAKDAATIHVEDKGMEFNTDLINAIETQNMVTFSQAILESALARRESRGSHYRTDYPTRNDEGWMKHILCVQKGEKPMISYKKVVIAGYAPEKRHY
ncbi:MAG: FAD-binding protein [Candidatus Diapherotrites archaeon]